MAKDLVSQIMAYEDGQMTEEEEITFFQYLLDSGSIYHLQGHYQRQLQRFLDEGLVIPKGGNNGQYHGN